jgi:hypothetical protein
MAEEEQPSVSIDMDYEVRAEMVKKDYVIFCPKNKDDLRRDYPELWDYPSLSKLTNPSELVFVWWYACRSSPIIDLPEEKRFPLAISKAYKGARANEVLSKYAPTGQAPSLPEEWKAAITTMNSFNPFMRIEMAVDNLFLLRQCQRHIRQENQGAQKDREDYLKTAALARKIQSEILKDIEKGNHGVEERHNTTLENLEDVSSTFHKQQVKR